jgi:hypothetical protein
MKPTLPRAREVEAFAWSSMTGPSDASYIILARSGESDPSAIQEDNCDFRAPSGGVRLGIRTMLVELRAFFGHLVSLFSALASHVR